MESTSSDRLSVTLSRPSRRTWRGRRGRLSSLSSTEPFSKRWSARSPVRSSSLSSLTSTDSSLHPHRIEYDASIHLLQKRIDHVFDSDEMRKLGPYQLCAILMRNGLNGRGSSWSIVKDVEGRWWKISDLNKEEVSFGRPRRRKGGADPLSYRSNLKMRARIPAAST